MYGTWKGKKLNPDYGRIEMSSSLSSNALLKSLNPDYGRIEIKILRQTHIQRRYVKPGLW